MNTQFVVYAIVALAPMLGVESLDTPRGPTIVDVPGRVDSLNQRWKRAPFGIHVVVETKKITIGIRDKMLGQKALNYLRLGAVKDEPTRTGKLKQRQKRKMVEQFRKSGNLYAANTDFKHIKPTDVHPFFGTGVARTSIK